RPTPSLNPSAHAGSWPNRPGGDGGGIKMPSNFQRPSGDREGKRPNVTMPNRDGGNFRDRGGRDALAKGGFGKDSFGKDGFGKDRFDRDKIGKDGFGKDRFDRDKIGKDGFGKDRFDRDKFAKDGFGRDKFDRDKFGKDDFGRDKFAFRDKGGDRWPDRRPDRDKLQNWFGFPKDGNFNGRTHIGDNNFNKNFQNA